MGPVAAVIELLMAFSHGLTAARAGTAAIVVLAGSSRNRRSAAGPQVLCVRRVPCTRETRGSSQASTETTGVYKVGRHRTCAKRRRRRSFALDRAARVATDVGPR